jgi:hypothetical protein
MTGPPGAPWIEITGERTLSTPIPPVGSGSFEANKDRRLSQKTMAGILIALFHFDDQRRVCGWRFLLTGFSQPNYYFSEKLI